MPHPRLGQVVRRVKSGIRKALSTSVRSSNGISDSETVKKIKSLTKLLEAERRDEAVATKAILAERGAEQYFVHPYSGHVYAVTGRYPYKLSGMLSSVWNFLDNPAGPLLMLSDGLSGATGLAYTTYDAWGKPVKGMPIRAYKESEQERFMEAMEAQEDTPYARFRYTGRQEYGLPGAGKYMLDVPSGMVDDLLEDGGRGFAIWRMDNVMTSQSYAPFFGVPYIDKKGNVKLAVGRHQEEAEEQYLGLLSAGVVKAPYFGEPDPAEFGFDIATRMG